MKLTLLVFLTTLFQVQAEMGYSQKKLSLHMESATIVEVLDEIQANSEFKFFYSEEDLDLDRKITINIEGETITTILDQVLDGTETAYQVKNKQIILTKKEEVPVSEKRAQIVKKREPVTVKGRVVDELQSGIPGVSVVIKGLNKGTTTDIEGYFRIDVEDTDVLIFSSVGFETQEVTVGSQSEIVIALKESITKLGDVEVVATGLFNRDKRSYTGAVTTVEKDELLKMSSQNVLSGLANIDPSFVQVQDLEMGSNPNNLPTYQVRGTSAISQNLQSDYENDPNQPLFILDGFETTATKIKDLDVNLIKSITLLKDATAKAIYGSKGANGVVVIETLRPEGGKLRVSYTGSLALEIPDLSSYNLTNAEEKLEIERLAGLYSSDNFETQLALNESYTAKLEEVMRGVDTDWLAQPVRTGIGHRHSIYLDGGENEMLYGVELSYNDIEGAMKGSSRETFTGGLTMTYRKQNILVRNRLAVTVNESSESPYGSFSEYAQMNPYSRLHDDDGNLVKDYEYELNNLVYNPLWNSQINTKYLTAYTDITNNLYAEWMIATGLKAVGRLGITNRKTSEDIFKPGDHTDFIGMEAARQGSYTQTTGNNLNANGIFGLSYSLISGDHLLVANAQGNFSSISYDRTTMVAEGFPNDKMEHVIFGIQYESGGKPYGTEGISHSLGALASLNYSYDERYLVDVNYNITGSSEYGANRRWGSFWSAGAGWNLHNEKFLENNPVISMLKLRASFGYTGSQGFNTYEALSTVKYYSSNVYNGNIGSYLVSMANPNLRWQSKYDQSVGVDFSLLRNFISGRVDYYVSNTESMLTDITLPGSTGFSYYRANLGKTENKGIEGTINVRLYQSESSRNYVNMYASASHVKNTLKEISNSLKTFNETQDDSKAGEQISDNYDAITTPSVRYIEGESINTIWAVPSLGIDPQNGQEIFLKKDGTVTYEWDADDQIAAGDAMPSVTGNVGLTGEFKNIGWNVSFYYRLGGQIYNSTLVDKVENANLYYNVDSRVYEDRWQQEGDISRFKSIQNTEYTLPTTRFVEDYNTLTLSAVNVYYDFRDTRFVQDSFIQKLRFSLNMNDVFVLSSVDIERGTSYPYARNVTFSISATF